MQFCPKCGRKLDDDATFCSECGFDIKIEADKLKKIYEEWLKYTWENQKGKIVISKLKSYRGVRNEINKRSPRVCGRWWNGKNSGDSFNKSMLS